MKITHVQSNGVILDNNGIVLPFYLFVDRKGKLVNVKVGQTVQKHYEVFLVV